MVYSGHRTLTNPTKPSDVVLILETERPDTSNIFAHSLRMVEAAAQRQGIDIIYGVRNRIEQSVLLGHEELIAGRPAFIYGSLQFVRDLKGPYAAYGYRGTDWTDFTAHYPRSWLINSEYAMTTWGDLIRHFDYWLERIDTLGLFVRPAASTKSFAGQYLTAKNWAIELSSLSSNTSVTDETLCVVAPFSDLIEEFRFFIVDGKVISGTSYATYGGRWITLSQQKSIPPGVLDLATKVANFQWQPDSCYTVDIGIQRDRKVGIIEFNSFCSAGVYHADMDAVLKAVADQTLRDFRI